MTAVFTAAVPLCSVLFVFLFNRYIDGLDADMHVCEMCDGTTLKDSPVWDFCQTKGIIEGRCCFENNTSRIVGYDLSNCSISHLEHLYNSSEAIIIDLSTNPISNLSDQVFWGFSSLAKLVLPSKLECPGGNASWEKTEVKNNARVCEGQKDTCNQTLSTSWNCPENSFCRPHGPGFFECNCFKDFHGYKCMRQGEFPIQKVLGILSASTIVVSSLLWFTQRRKVKNT